jgi:hypothetical protein
MMLPILFRLINCLSLTRSPRRIVAPDNNSYTLPLHRCREAGYHHRVFDLLDEGRFNHDQLRSIVSFLFGRENVPDPLIDWKEFIGQVEEMNKSVAKEWNIKTEKLSDWFDKREMTTQFGPKRGLFGCCG